jgi:hypothetical protein
MISQRHIGMPQLAPHVHSHIAIIIIQIDLFSLITITTMAAIDPNIICAV